MGAADNAESKRGFDGSARRRVLPVDHDMHQCRIVLFVPDGVLLESHAGRALRVTSGVSRSVASCNERSGAVKKPPEPLGRLLTVALWDQQFTLNSTGPGPGAFVDGLRQSTPNLFPHGRNIPPPNERCACNSVPRAWYVTIFVGEI